MKRTSFITHEVVILQERQDPGNIHEVYNQRPANGIKIEKEN